MKKTVFYLLGLFLMAGILFAELPAPVNHCHASPKDKCSKFTASSGASVWDCETGAETDNCKN
jgi:hypothetical protein